MLSCLQPVSALLLAPEFVLPFALPDVLDLDLYDPLTQIFQPLGFQLDSFTGNRPWNVGGQEQKLGVPLAEPFSRTHQGPGGGWTLALPSHTRPSLPQPPLLRDGHISTVACFIPAPSELVSSPPERSACQLEGDVVGMWWGQKARDKARASHHQFQQDPE